MESKSHKQALGNLENKIGDKNVSAVRNLRFRS